MDIWLSHGMTESGDALPFILYATRPEDAEVYENYRRLCPAEFDEEGCYVYPQIERLGLPAGIAADVAMLNKLIAGGVDNWDGYDNAMEVE